MPALQEARIDAVVLQDDALAIGCSDNFGLIVPDGDDLRLVTRLPARAVLAVDTATGPAQLPAAPAPEATATPPVGAMSDARAMPTHVLHDNRALPLGHPALDFAVVRHGEVALLRAADGLTLNGTTIFRETALEIGDRVARHGREYLVISVED
jgi:hypothetical protein